MLELATNQIPKLLVIADLFEELHKNDIVYCNLKGNEQHLRISMTGESDIDILFDENQKVKLEPVLNTLGFKKFSAIRQKQYKDIVDFIGLDSESGKIVHLHTYYRLTIGEPYLKGYQLNIENYVLSSREFNEEFRMYCIQPAFELVLLYLTESLKLRHRDLVLMYLRSKNSFNAKVLYEYTWLKKRTNDAEIEAVLKSIFEDYDTVNTLVKAEFNRQQIVRIAPAIKKEFSRYRLYSPLTGLLYRWYREATVTLFRKLSRIVAHPILSKRVNPRGGIIVAVIGAGIEDKSDVTDLLKQTFEKKLDVYKFNFGKPDSGNARSRGKDNVFRSMYNCVEVLIATREKRNKIKLVESAKKKGALVICDRYPQNQIMGYHDGPVLYDLMSSRNLFFRTIARIEANTYAQAENHAPDILFKFIAGDADRRKAGESSRENHDTEINASIKQLKFSNKCKVVTIDAAKPLREVLCIMKKEIWNFL